MNAKFSFGLAVTLFLISCRMASAMEGQVFIVTKNGQSIKFSLVTVSIHPRAEVEAYIAKKKTAIQPAYKKLTAESLNLSKAKKYEEAVVRADQALAILRDFFNDFDRSAALSRTKTDADGKFKLDPPSQKDVVLFATAKRTVGDDIESYEWILPPEEWEDPLFLSNGNVFTLHPGASTELLSGNKEKVRQGQIEKNRQAK